MYGEQKSIVIYKMNADSMIKDILATLCLIFLIYMVRRRQDTKSYCVLNCSSRRIGIPFGTIY